MKIVRLTVYVEKALVWRNDPLDLVRHVIVKTKTMSELSKSWVSNLLGGPELQFGVQDSVDLQVTDQTIASIPDLSSSKYDVESHNEDYFVLIGNINIPIPPLVSSYLGYSFGISLRIRVQLDSSWPTSSGDKGKYYPPENLVIDIAGFDKTIDYGKVAFKKVGGVYEGFWDILGLVRLTTEIPSAYVRLTYRVEVVGHAGGDVDYDYVVSYDLFGFTNLLTWSSDELEDWTLVDDGLTQTLELARV